jgi:hypothetical protein
MKQKLARNEQLNLNLKKVLNINNKDNTNNKINENSILNDLKIFNKNNNYINNDNSKLVKYKFDSKSILENFDQINNKNNSIQEKLNLNNNKNKKNFTVDDTNKINNLWTNISSKSLTTNNADLSIEKYKNIINNFKNEIEEYKEQKNKEKKQNFEQINNTNKKCNNQYFIDILNSSKIQQNKPCFLQHKNITENSMELKNNLNSEFENNSNLNFENNSELNNNFGIIYGNFLYKLNFKKIWKKRYFTIIINYQLNPSFDNTLKNKNGDGNSVDNKKYIPAEKLETENYLLLEYKTAINSQWGLIPLQFKRFFYLQNLKSILVDSNKKNNGLHFSLNFLNNNNKMTVDKNKFEITKQDNIKQNIGNNNNNINNENEVGNAVHNLNNQKNNDNTTININNKSFLQNNNNNCNNDDEKVIKNIDNIEIDSSSNESNATKITIENNNIDDDDIDFNKDNTNIITNNNNNKNNNSIINNTNNKSSSNTISNIATTRNIENKKIKLLTIKLKAYNSEERFLWTKQLLFLCKNDTYCNVNL